MNANDNEQERHVKTLRAWQLLLLRFAVTLDNADRLSVLMIAAGMDRLGPKQHGKPEFRFFRNASAELCAAIQRPNELTPMVLRKYLARIDDDRLRRSFAAAVQIEQSTTASTSRPVKRDKGLWRGLSSRGSSLL